MAPTPPASSGQEIDPAVIVAALAAFDRHGTIGALEIGVLISILLLGLVTVQTYYYYSKFPDDHIATKLLVAFVMLCEYGQAISVCHTLYEVTITFYGNPLALQHPPKSLSVSILFSGFIGPLVQAFFANRIRMISHQLIIPVACWILSFLRFLGSIVASAEALQMKDLPTFEHDWKWLLTTILSLGAGVDLIIALSLSYYLMQQRAGAYKSTAKVIDKLIAWSIETGLLTSIAGITMLVCFLKMQSNFVWLGFFMFLGRLFSNSLLAALNARETLRNIKEAVVELTDHTSYTAGRSNLQRTGGGISIEMTKQISSDAELKFAEHDRSKLGSSGY